MDAPSVRVSAVLYAANAYRSSGRSERPPSLAGYMLSP